MTEMEITKKIIDKFNSKRSFCYILKAGKKDKNVLNYEYDIEVVLKNTNQTVAIIEAKKRFETSRPTTDAMFASIVKLSYEYLLNFNTKPNMFFMFYLNNPILEVEKEFRNNIFCL